MLPNRPEHVLADLGALHAGRSPGHLLRHAGRRAGRLRGRQLRRRGSRCWTAPTELARWQPVLAQLPGAAQGHRAGRAPPARAGEPYLSWAAFVGAGRGTGWPPAGEVAGRVAAITPGRPGHPAVHLGHDRQPQGRDHHPRAACCTKWPPAQRSRQRHRCTCAGCPTCRWRTSPSGCSPCTWPICNGGHVHFCHDAPASWSARWAQVQPTAFFGVPRVWEKIQAGIQALLAAEQDEARKAAVAAAMDTGLAYVRSCQYGQSTPPELAAAVRGGRRAGAAARSGRCSGWARPRSWSAPRRRCRRTSARSSPGSACGSWTSTG